MGDYKTDILKDENDYPEKSNEPTEQPHIEQPLDGDMAPTGEQNEASTVAADGRTDDALESSRSSGSQSPHVIISLTTYPARIGKVKYAIETLLYQSRPADRVILWLAREQFPYGESELPKDLLRLCESGLSLEWCEDIKSYKKIIPAVEKYPESVIITADDDILYPRDMVEILLGSFERHPDCVSALRTHLMRFGQDGLPLPYGEWLHEYSGIIDQPAMSFFATTGAGTLFPPHILPPQTFERDRFMALCPNADDIWIKLMLTIGGVPVVQAAKNRRLCYVENTQDDALWKSNREADGNDAQLIAALQAFASPETGTAAICEPMNDLEDHKPEQSQCLKFSKRKSTENENRGTKVSIIINTVGYTGSAKGCMRSAMSQTMAEAEIILVCEDGSKAHMAARGMESDGRMSTIVLAPHTDKSAALRRAAQQCTGEYVILPDPAGILAPDACELLYAAAQEKDADILRFSRGTISAAGSDIEKLDEAVIEPLFGKKIVERLFCPEALKQLKCDPYPALCATDGALFGGRMLRNALLYIDGEADNGEGGLLAMYLLAYCARTFVSIDTQVCFVIPREEREKRREEVLESCLYSGDLRGILGFLTLAGAQEEIFAAAREMELPCVQKCVEHRLYSPNREKDVWSRLRDRWGAGAAAAATASCSPEHRQSLVAELRQSGVLDCPRRLCSRIGIVTRGAGDAQSLYLAAELASLLSERYEVSLIGLSKKDASNAVITGRVACEGEEIRALGEPLKLGEAFDRIITSNRYDLLIINAEDDGYTQFAVNARMRGIPVIAVLPSPFGIQMLESSANSVTIEQLRLAAVTVTASARQERLLSLLGVCSRCIPYPALKLWSGRNNGRATANAVVWIGKANDAVSRYSDAVDIFLRVKRMSAGLRMLMYFDCAHDETEELDALESSITDSGISIRRLRPDFGVFDDAAAFLMTGTACISPPELRAATVLGVPTVMYQLANEPVSNDNVTVVPAGDRRAAADALKLSLEQSRREQATPLRGTGSADGLSPAKLWRDAIETAGDDCDGRLLITDEREARLSGTLEACFAMYERGAAFSAERLRASSERYQALERAANESAEREKCEAAAAQKKLDELKKQLDRQKRENEAQKRQLEEILGSTTYKAGRALTIVPRGIKAAVQKAKGKKN